MKPDLILVRGLEVESRIGATAEERRHPQRLQLSLEIEPETGFEAAGDDLAKTVDYAAVCAAVRALAGRGERALVETLAAEIAALVLRDFPARAVAVELRKFVVPGTECVGVRLERHR